MPHVNSSGGDDLAANDEIKVWDEEGENENENSTSENLSEDKLVLVEETEDDKADLHRRDFDGDKRDSDTNGKMLDPLHERLMSPFGTYLVSPFYQHAALSPLSGKMVPHPPSLSLMYNDPLASPPPAHMGIPPVHIDPKTGLPRPPVYAIPPPHGQFLPHPFYSSDVNWGSSYGMGLRGAYPPHSLGASFARFSPSGLLPHGLPHPAHSSLFSPKQEGLDRSPGANSNLENRSPTPQGQRKKYPYIKKPLNAFMLFMKEQRAKVSAEGTLKESAAINQILGRKWHSLDRVEQSKYYELARKEKELHMQMYPGWSARDNYASHAKKKKRKRSECQDKSVIGVENGDCNNPKKCRARFGLDQQSQWCKPCRRKKKCIRFMMDDDEMDSCSEDMSDTHHSFIDSTTDVDGLSIGTDSPNPKQRPDIGHDVQHPMVSQSTEQ